MSIQAIIVRCDAFACSETTNKAQLDADGWASVEVAISARQTLLFDYCPSHVSDQIKESARKVLGIFNISKEDKNG